MDKTQSVTRPVTYRVFLFCLLFPFLYFSIVLPLKGHDFVCPLKSEFSRVAILSSCLSFEVRGCVPPL